MSLLFCEFPPKSAQISLAALDAESSSFDKVLENSARHWVFETFLALADEEARNACAAHHSELGHKYYKQQESLIRNILSINPPVDGRLFYTPDKWRCSVVFANRVITEIDGFLKGWVGYVSGLSTGEEIAPFWVQKRDGWQKSPASLRYIQTWEAPKADAQRFEVDDKAKGVFFMSRGRRLFIVQGDPCSPSLEAIRFDLSEELNAPAPSPSFSGTVGGDAPRAAGFDL